MFNKVKYNKNCTCCLSGEERLQIEKSKRIDRELASYKRRFRATQKIVLLGAGESGKSTFLKQMQIIHGNGFSHDEKIIFRTQIYENILRGMAGLINGKKELQIPWSGSGFIGDTTNRVEIATRMRQIVSQFSSIYKHLMDEREQESARLNKRLVILPEQFIKNGLIDFIIEIWNDYSIQEAFERRREFPRYFVENVPYFIENLSRIGQRDYIPDAADILRCRRATTTINEVEMDIKSVPFRFVDVGGQRTQRQKWHQCFSDVTAILFLASASEYDEYLREDGRTNRLEESCKVFETLVNYKYLRNVEFILFLNKHDLLKEKITKINIKDYCHDFVGNPSLLKDVEAYLIKKFSSLKRHENQLQYNRNNRFSNNNDEFDSVMENDLNNNQISYERNGAVISDKTIYSHFTTAIDTNNIKTIFEMVRLMIFEKNCKAIMLN